MPVIDKPLKELKVYQGINPCPADFEQYWEESLAEMKALDKNVTITPAWFKSPVADCYDMYFTGVHGARVYAKLLKPKKIEGKCPAVVIFHGYSGAGETWAHCLEYAASGFVVAAIDARGQAGKSEDVGGHIGNTMIGQIVKGLENDDPKMLLFRDVFLD